MIACHYFKQYSQRIPSATWQILKNNSSVAAPKMCWRLNRANKTTTDKVLAGSEEHCVHNKRPQEVRVTAGQREAGARATSLTSTRLIQSPFLCTFTGALVDYTQKQNTQSIIYNT